MFKYFVFCISVIFSVQIQADTQSLDVVMKEMALSYKHAQQAATNAEFKRYLDEIDAALKLTADIGFKNKQEESMVGIRQVQTVVVDIKSNNYNLDEAKKQLKKIDNLRKQYHKLHEPSIWQLLFGN